MENLKRFDEFDKVNEDLGTDIFLGIFFTIFGGMLASVAYMFLVKPPIAYMRRFINKLKANRQFRKEIIEIIQTMTSSQKRELKKYIKNSVFAKWNIVTTEFEGGSETSYDRDPELDVEKERLLGIFDEEQREKLENLFDKLESEVRHQTMRDSDEWGVKTPDPDLSLSWKPKLNLRSLKDKSRDEERMEHRKKYEEEEGKKKAELDRIKKAKTQQILSNPNIGGRDQTDTHVWDNYKYKGDEINEELFGNVEEATFGGKTYKLGDRIIEFDDWVSHEREVERGRGVIKKIKADRSGKVKRLSVLFDPKNGKPAYLNKFVYPEQTELEEGYVPWDVKDRERKELNREKRRFRQTSDTSTFDNYRYKSKR